MLAKFKIEILIIKDNWSQNPAHIAKLSLDQTQNLHYVAIALNIFTIPSRTGVLPLMHVVTRMEQVDLQPQ